MIRRWPLFVALGVSSLAAAIVGAQVAVVAPAPLVARNQVRLTLSGAEVILRAAQEKARELKLNVNLAVADDGGHLIAFQRMDGARPASVYTAITKATAAATLRKPTGPASAGDDSAVWLSLSLEHTAAASGGKLTTLYGGVPVILDGQVAGAVGVGGGTGQQDAEIARAGIERLLQELSR
ncbi:MAG: heme-binding protein [Pirellulales bacterium]